MAERDNTHPYMEEHRGERGRARTAEVRSRETRERPHESPSGQSRSHDTRSHHASTRHEESRSHESRGRESSSSGHAAHPLTNHRDIRKWAESRGGQPACVKGTGAKGGVGMIRLDFPGYSGGDSLQHISWDEWFKSFDDNGLALLVQERTAGGEESHFNKLVARETAEGKRQSRRRR